MKLKPFAILRASQSLYDDVTLGPYGTYEAQTYYFHDPSPVEVIFETNPDPTYNVLINNIFCRMMECTRL